VIDLGDNAYTLISGCSFSRIEDKEGGGRTSMMPLNMYHVHESQNYSHSRCKYIQNWIYAKQAIAIMAMEAAVSDSSER
jgi:hypothetical protein